MFSKDQGYVNVFHFNNDTLSSGSTTRNDAPKVIYLERDSEIGFLPWGKLWKRKAHNDWVLKIKDVPKFRFIISCSPDPKDSLVIARYEDHQWKYSKVSVYKGVNCVAFGSKPLSLITGGSDRKLRFWNPHKLTTPTVTLRGHLTPIIEIQVNETRSQVISMSRDKELKIWDLKFHNCLQSLCNPTIEHQFTAMTLNPIGRGMIIVANSNIHYFNLGLYSQLTDNPKSHQSPIRGLIYNSKFNQIISGCDGGIITIWDPLNGSRTFKFENAHDGSEITAMAFDTSGRRLITGGRNGTIRTWNFNNGQLLQDLVKGEEGEVTNLIYVELKKCGYILATGWDKKVTIFINDNSVSVLHPAFFWPGDQLAQSWHRDDILSMAFCAPATIATSSYDGIFVTLS